MKVDPIPITNEFGEPRTAEQLDFETLAERMRIMCLNRGGEFTGMWEAICAGALPGWRTLP